MTTRRNMIKAGAGLAAILASGKAPAYLVKSMLAARNSIGMKSGGAKLPYDSEVEYLESTGTQWIDTRYVLTSNNTKVEALFYSTQLGGQVIFGSEGSDGGRCLTPLLYVDGKDLFSLFIANRARAIKDIYAPAGLYSIVIESKEIGSVELNCNGNVYTGTFVGNVFRGLPIALFAERFGTYVGYYTKNLKFYSFKLWDNGVLVRDFIPVRFTNEQGVSEGATYDRANPTVGMNRDGTPRDDGLYLNRGTGVFGYGNDK